MLIALVSFAPIARAMCDIELLSGTGHSDTYVAAVAGVTNPDSAKRDLCCADLPDSVTERTGPAAFDNGVTPSVPALPDLSPASSYLASPVAQLGDTTRRTPLPPVERAFRRVPKLLI